MKRLLLLGTAIFAFSGCEVSEDPADGGFISGVVGVAGGGYQRRIDALEATLAADQARANSLASEQLRLQAQSASISAQIRNQTAQLAALKKVVNDRVALLEATGTTVGSGMAVRVRATANAAPSGRTDAERLASLRAAIANARALSADLSQLS